MALRGRWSWNGSMLLPVGRLFGAALGRKTRRQHRSGLSKHCREGVEVP
jgi:hypothetical protein